jgi:protein involved in polysaccharide export with SLBB domain
LALLAVTALVASSAPAVQQRPGGLNGSVGEAGGLALPGFESEPTLPGVMAGVVNPDQYLVGPGDLFLLNFTGRITRSLNLAVGPEGTLFLPGIGAVRIDGMTLSQARREIVRRAATEYRGVEVDVRLAHARTLRVFLTGEVKEPGPLDVAAWSRISEVLSDSLLTERASRRNIVITRDRPTRDPTGASVPDRLLADLDLFNRTGDATFNPFLHDGDVVYVPVATRHVIVAGAVARPGRFELGPHDSLNTVLRMAAGPLPSSRDERCLLVRWRTPTEGESLFFSLSDAESGATNPPMRDGDRLYVYFHPRYHALEHASIYGEVQAPGAYPLQTNHTRLSDLVRAAGGFLDRADLSTLRVYRASLTATENDPELDRLTRLSRGEMTASEYEVMRARLAARREEYRIDWTRLRSNADLDLLLRDGDIVRVDPVLASVRVEGEVRRPGLVEFESGRTFRDYVTLAGGFSNRAARSKVRITRTVTGQTLLARDVGEIAPGDLIWVPERPDVTTWQHLQTLIAVAAQVATLIIAVRR